MFTSARGTISGFSYAGGFDELQVGSYFSLSEAQAASQGSYHALAIDNVKAELTAPVIGVLGNDTDADGNPLTAALVTGPANGTLSFNANGTFAYTPNANFHGKDSFTYRASDGKAVSNTATVTITVNPVNDAPAAQDDSYSVAEDNLLTVPAAGGVLPNDSDVDGNPLTAILGAARCTAA